MAFASRAIAGQRPQLTTVAAPSIALPRPRPELGALGAGLLTVAALAVISVAVVQLAMVSALAFVFLLVIYMPVLLVVGWLQAMRLAGDFLGVDL